MSKSLPILSCHEGKIYNIRNWLFSECDTVDKSVITVIPHGDWTSAVLKSGNLMTTRTTQMSLGRLCTIMYVVTEFVTLVIAKYFKATEQNPCSQAGGCWNSRDTKLLLSNPKVRCPSPLSQDPHVSKSHFPISFLPPHLRLRHQGGFIPLRFRLNDI